MLIQYGSQLHTCIYHYSIEVVMHTRVYGFVVVSLAVCWLDDFTVPMPASLGILLLC